MNNDGRHVGLIVEDDLEMATELKELFTALGLEYVHAATAEEAVPLIEAGAFCFALVDLQIKAKADSLRARVETGITLLQDLRKRYPRRERGRQARAPDRRHERPCERSPP